MKNSTVSKAYFNACERIHDAADMLYESLHEDDGDAVTELDDVLIEIKSFRDWVNIEIDLVREICKEHENESPF
jgi:phage terminase large subunit|tara:strand:+ start:762 stop:983 length:222 start_codon:yes stop_codon:yes gene_type:complete